MKMTGFSIRTWQDQYYDGTLEEPVRKKKYASARKAEKRGAYGERKKDLYAIKNKY
ncbi:hypothetical protein YDYSY3_04450 [Paenibacillus chitinolyticus]|uniref:hypothetical protein n=1 Tax=Paenibacillus chitinolyticus TaxID=79263 RepID=UPI0026E49BD9|nr:hypothetical protein [Paenibacillus chitinolyticus]GKS09445.1 hypothetical protein YDYSY3_04450 [Paenibacillus chitinolyticus]